VSLPLPHLVALLGWLRPTSRPQIVIGAAQDLYLTARPLRVTSSTR
jgi:hypothetical protein